MYNSCRYAVVGTFMNSFGLALIPVLVPGMKYIYPMEVQFVNETSVNYYINFGVQTVGFVEAAVIFYIFSLIFFIFTMNLLCELKLIARLCEQIGENEEKLVPLLVNRQSGSLSTDVLQEIHDDLRSSNVAEDFDTKTLLGVIVKYHGDVLK